MPTHNLIQTHNQGLGTEVLYTKEIFGLQSFFNGWQAGAIAEQL